MQGESCLMRCCHRFAWAATRSWELPARCAPLAGRDSPSSHRRTAPAAARPSAKTWATMPFAAPALRTGRATAGRAQPWSTTRRAGGWCCPSSMAIAPISPKPAAAGWHASVRSSWPRPIWWRRSRCIGGGCSCAATTRRFCWRAACHAGCRKSSHRSCCADAMDRIAGRPQGQGKAQQRAAGFRHSSSLGPVPRGQVRAPGR